MRVLWSIFSFPSATLALLLCTGLGQRYMKEEAEVFNALLTLIRDTSVLREYAAAALAIMQVFVCCLLRQDARAAWVLCGLTVAALLPRSAVLPWHTAPLTSTLLSPCPCCLLRPSSPTQCAARPLRCAAALCALCQQPVPAAAA